jgi:hypothetical protein
LDANSFVGPKAWSWDNKLQLRTAYKNSVLSVGVEGLDVFAESKVPKIASIETSVIHDVNHDVRLYGGLSFGVNVHPFRLQTASILAGVNYLSHHRLVVVAKGEGCMVKVPGDKSQNIEDKEEFKFGCPSVRVMGRSKVNDSLEAYCELNLKKECNTKDVCCEKSLSVAAEYEVDSKTKLKAKASCNGDLVLSYLHSYGVCNFGFVSRVL